MSSEVPVSKTAKHLDNTWKTLTLIGSIAAAGFGAAMFLGGFQTQADAAAQHKVLRTEQQDAAKLATSRFEEVDEDLQAQRYIQIRIEIAQQQLLDESRLEREHERRTRTRAEHSERQARIEELEERIEIRAGALKRSYDARPAAPSHEIDSRDPLAAAKRL
jgi:hypothetical protein